MLFLLLALAVASCESQSQPGNAAAEASPHAGAAELRSGEQHEFNGGNSVTVHAVDHRFVGSFSDDELLVLTADVEFCAGSMPMDPPIEDLRLFLETAVDMQGTRMVMHAFNSPAGLGLKQPAFDYSTTIQTGQCLRGWVEFLNVYDEQGAPTMLGFGEDPDNPEVVWTAAEG
jgi:hypothetical protein